MKETASIIHPEPSLNKTSVWPVFLPFQGCENKCIYCAQDIQTGKTDTKLEQSYLDLRQKLHRSLTSHESPVEIGFYGGTFTRVDPKWQKRFLSLAVQYKKRGLISRIRCSTRPDAIFPENLQLLQENGMDMIELGIQSMNDQVLLASKRGYSSEAAGRACHMVREFGFHLGVQLMAGLPKQDPSSWQAEIRAVCNLRPGFVRIYPCLVLRGTELEQLWSDGRYIPWGLNRTVTQIARATLRFWRHCIPVVRIGLAPEQGLPSHIKAGPWHYALGSMVRSHFLFHWLLSCVIAYGNGPLRWLDCPSKYQGELWGYRSSNKERLGSLGITSENTRFLPQKKFTLYW